MNCNISKLIRATYAMNIIESVATDSRFASIDPKEVAVEYFNTQLTRMSNGRSVSCCGEYALKIFEDIYAKTGYDFTGRNFANARKQMIGAIVLYENKTGKDYMPSGGKRDAVIKYVDCTSWQQLCEDCGDLLEEAEAYLTDVASGICQPNIMNMVFCPQSIGRGNELNIRFKDGSKLCLSVICGKEFRVISAIDTGLTAKDIIVISDHVIIGNKLCAEVKMTSCSRFNSLWLSPSAVKSFSVKEAHISLIA